MEPSRRTLSAPTRAYDAVARRAGPSGSGTTVTGMPASVRLAANVRPSNPGADSRASTRTIRPRAWACLSASRTVSLELSVTEIQGGAAIFRKVREIRLRVPSSSARVASRTAFGSWPSETSRATRCATLWTIAIAGCAAEIRRATSVSAFGSGRPFDSIIASPIVSRAIRASLEAPLVRSSAMAWIASSTGSGSMFHPRVVRREALDADADPPFEEVPRMPLRRADRHLVQLSEDAVLPRGGELLADDAGPFRVRDDHRFDRGLGIRVGSVVAEQERSRVEGEEPLKGLEVFLQVEGGRRRDRHEDFVTGKVEACGIAGVHAAGVLIEDRELMGRVTRGIEEDQSVLPEFEALLILHRDESVRRNRTHRAEDMRLLGAERLPRARDEPRRVDEMLETSFVDVHLGLRHFRDQESRSAGMVQVDVRNHHHIDVRGSQAERPHRFEDSFRIPGRSRLDDRLALVVDQVHRTESFLLEHADVCEVGFRVERKPLERHPSRDCRLRHVPFPRGLRPIVVASKPPRPSIHRGQSARNAFLHPGDFGGARR